MDSELYLALVNDEIDVLKGMGGLQVRDQRTPTNNTMLHLACQYGSIECVKEILSSHESLLLQTNSRGETALHLAARLGQYDAVKALINKAKSIDVQNTSQTVLPNMIRAPNLELETALHAAVRYNDEKVVELLVKEDPSYSYPQNKYKETPLYLAAIRQYGGVTKLILDNCELPTFGGPDGRTALHASLISALNGLGDGDCTDLLLEKNKDLIRVADNNGWTAFHYAAHNNLFAWVNTLAKVDKSVAYLADKKYKRTALHVAAYKGHYNVIRELLIYLPDVWDSVDGNGQNILHIAVMQDHKYLIRLILSGSIQEFVMTNALFIQRDKEGNTPLHLIAKFGRYIPQLQNADEWNVDWDLVDDTNFTPRNVFHEKQIGTLIDEALVGVPLDRTQVQNIWDRWNKSKVAVLPVADVEENEDVDEESMIKEYKEVVNTHIIVAALITTVALTAGFAMPSGFDGNQGPDQGSAVLLRKTSFKTFIVADTLTLLLSISSLFLYFLTSIYYEKRVVQRLILAATVLNVVSITAMMVAFIAGTSAVLSHSSSLTITVCVISSLFFLLVFYACFRYFRRIIYVLKSN